MLTVATWICPVLWLTLLLSGCSDVDTRRIDALNETAYAYHYRNLDSTRTYAERALRLADGYDDGRAEALNHLAFVSMAHMDYNQVRNLIGNLAKVTDNQIELLIADVQMMRLCQRQSHNKDFYIYRDKAIRRIRRIEEERDLLTDHQRKRMAYAYTEYHIVASIYFYYIGLTKESVSELESLEQSNYLLQDSVQTLNYLYNIGAGGIVTSGTYAEIKQTEFDYLMRCYVSAQQMDVPFFEAQSLQGMSEHLRAANDRAKLMTDNRQAMNFVNTDAMPDSLIAGNLAQRALDIFKSYGDVYQIAGSYRTLAECYWSLQDFRSALICLHRALDEDTVIQRAPDLVASIREQLSLAYSAVNDKQSSDFNRNVYLDMQEKTRQDRQLEARAEQLEHSSHILNGMMAAVILMIVVMMALFFIFDTMRHRSERRFSVDNLLEPLRQWREDSLRRMEEQEEEREEIAEQTQLTLLHLAENKKRNLEQRAKVALVNSVTPFIDRIIHEVKSLKKETTNDAAKATATERLTYIAELADTINDHNAVLTEWIRIRQGSLNLRIESFRLKDLLAIVAKGKMAFAMKGIELDVEPTEAVAKADKTLTLFMINTLADNARKFTPKGGRVLIEATQQKDCVEVSVTDTGVGMTEAQLAHIFDHKPITDPQGSLCEDQGHGFGLMNCKGIIEKYKKTSQLFSVCDIGAESDGHGSRFWFRLPLGIVRTIVALLLLFPTTGFATTALQRGYQYADSTYYSNIAGTYSHTLQMADSCAYYFNLYYRSLQPNGDELMTIYDANGGQPAEQRWFKSQLKMDYLYILGMRNEVAVAALALHLWDTYEYNNKAYTKLFRERSADNTLDSYVKTMRKSEANKNVAITFLVIILLLLFPAYYILYYRYRLMYRFCLERIQHINEILLDTQATEKKLTSIERLWKEGKLAGDGRYANLDKLVGQICDALRQRIDADRKQNESIELARDELRRRQYENDRLHVSNSVLDNCLSTLKHETMYYPSRIHQLVDSFPADLNALEEIAEYYKALYTILSAQAMRQTEGGLRIDESLTSYLLDTLRRCNAGQPIEYQAADRDERYLTLLVSLPQLSLSAQQCHLLFTAYTTDVRFLVCRQIVREIGEALQARACGIEATPAETGITIAIVIPKKIWKNSK